MIDPLECVIRWLGQDPALAELVGTRIAARHRYGDTWTTGQTGLTVRLDGGTPDLYGAVQRVRLEARCYAPSQHEATEIWRRVAKLCRETARESVPTSEGASLLYWLHQASGPSLLHDGEIGLDFTLAFLDALVAEESTQ